MRKVLEPFLKINEDYNKASLKIWELHRKISSQGVSLKDEDEDPKFMVYNMKLGTNDYVKNVLVQEILQFDEDESLMFLFFNDPNSDLQGCVGLLCNEEKLSDKLNFPLSIKVGVNISNIGVLNGENICV